MTALAPGQTSPGITDETVALVRGAMAETTRAITTGSGLIGYELDAPAKVIVPVITPLVNLLPRRRGQGIDIVHWKGITSFDTARNWGVVADGTLPSQVTYAVASMQNTMQTECYHCLLALRPAHSRAESQSGPFHLASQVTR
jgi:hypothetical protein